MRSRHIQSRRKKSWGGIRSPRTPGRRASPRTSKARTWWEFAKEYKYRIMMAAAATTVAAMMLRNDTLSYDSVKAAVKRMTGFGPEFVPSDAEIAQLSTKAVKMDAKAQKTAADKALLDIQKTEAELRKAVGRDPTNGAIENFQAALKTTEIAKNKLEEAQQTLQTATTNNFAARVDVAREAINKFNADGTVPKTSIKQITIDRIAKNKDALLAKQGLRIAL